MNLSSPQRRTVLNLTSVLLMAVASAGGEHIASAAPPVLSHLFPAGGQRGTKVTVTASGEFSWPIKVWGPGLEIVPAADAGKLEVTIPADLPADRVWVRLFNAEGASATAPFLIGSLPEMEEKEPNNAPRTAQAVSALPVTVNGVLTSADVDAFAVSLEAGQTLVASVDANTRLGSPMDAVLQVTAADGTVVAENHDDLHLDPRLAYRAPRAGIYLVRLFSFPSTPGTKIEYHGGANCVYRLTLTTGPFITHTIPLSARISELGTVEAHGWNIPPGTRLPVVPFGIGSSIETIEFEPASDLRISPDARLGLVFAPTIGGGARVRLNPSEAGQGTDAPSAEGMLPMPGSATGWLKSPGQTDRYRVSLKAGQTIVAVVESRSFGLLLDPLMTLADPTGAVAAEVDDTGGLRDAALIHRAARDGDYQLTIRDRYRQGGERCCYLLTVRLEEPEFELTTATDAIVIPSGKSAEVPIKIRRFGTDGALGAIAITTVGLPAEVQGGAIVSEPTGPTATEVKLTLTATGTGFSGPIRISGKAEQPRIQERFARTPPRLGAALESIWLTVVGAP